MGKVSTKKIFQVVSQVFTLTKKFHQFFNQQNKFRNEYGQSGNGTISPTAPMRAPQYVPQIAAGKTLLYVAKSATSIFAATSDNTYYAWGSKYVTKNQYGTSIY